MNIKVFISNVLKRVFNPIICYHSSIEENTKILPGVELRNVDVGDYTYIGDRTRVSYAKIGKFCSIAGNCTIGGGSHPANYVSTSPIFYNGKNIFRRNFAQHEYYPFRETIIGNDVWIGCGSFIKAGVIIGDGAIIGMGSVVTHDVKPYEIWAGNPARLIKRRFSIDISQKLEMIKWWNMTEKELMTYVQFFNKPESMIEIFEKKNENTTY